MTIFDFSKAFWRVFGRRILETLYKPSTLRYDFGLGAQDVRIVCRYWKEEKTRIVLQRVIDANTLNRGTTTSTMRAIMTWLIKEYPVAFYYKKDTRETWNRPEETLQSFEDKRNNQNRVSTDCDDWAILIYNLARLCNIPASDLRLCFMKTRTEWHLNVMCFVEGVPYAVEGTYYPSIALANFGTLPYFQNALIVNGELSPYYYGVRWLWNEDSLWMNTGKLNEV